VAGKGTSAMSTHRADYIFQRGVWVAKCRICHFQVTDPIRRRAADQFRMHIRGALQGVIDLDDREVQPLAHEQA
jgi:hypothetical protein